MEELRLVHVCVNFPHPLSPLLSFWVFPLLRSWARERNEQLIVSIYLFSVVLNISKACHRKKILHLFARSKFSAKFLLRPIPIYFLWLKVRSDFRLVMCRISENVQRLLRTDLLNEQECILSGLKTRGEAESFYNW